MFGRLLFVIVVTAGIVAYANAPEGRAASANVTQTCSVTRPGTTTVTWSWPAPAAGAQQTWFDISLVPGFAWGWFQGYGPLPASSTAYALDGIPPGLTYYYRVNTLYSGGVWKQSASGSFISGCGGGGGSGGPPVTIDAMQSCDGYGGVTVTFKWQANASGVQFLDLSTMNNGFAPGTFVGAGPVGNGQGSFTWYGIARGLTHFWRVNTLTASGWVSSNTGAFTSLTCLPAIQQCVGYMAGYTSVGRAECEQVMAGPDANLAACVGDILGVKPPNNGCVNFQLTTSGSRNLADCLLKLNGQSRYSGGACPTYWSTGQ
jgi:hypothetical protein